MKKLFLALLIPVVCLAQSTPISLQQLYAQHPAAPLTGGEIVAMQQGAQSVGALTSQLAAYIGASSVFSPGCALAGSVASQTVVLNSGCFTGSLPLTSIALNSVSPAVLTNVGNIPQWIHVGVGLTYSSFSAAATSNSIALFTLPANGVVEAIKIKQSASFTGGSISAYTISVGDSGSAVRFASGFNVFQAPGTGVFGLSQTLAGEDTSSATTIYATAISAGANLNAATAGAVDIFAKVAIVQ